MSCQRTERQTEIRKHRVQQSIKIIAEIVVNMSIVARIKFSSKLKVFTFAVGYYSYTDRSPQAKK